MRQALLCLVLWGLFYPAFSSSTLTMSYGGLTRDFIVHLPAGYASGQHLPVVFNFHGYGETAANHELYTNMDVTADANHFIVVYPDGVSAEWNVGWFGAYGTGVDDVGFTSAMIDTLSILYGINLNRVYACGLSNGGFLSHRLACELSNRIAAVAPVAGTLTDSTAFYCTSSHKVPVMHVHGTADPVVAYNGLVGSLSVEQSIQFWTGKDQCTATTDTTFVANTNLLDSSTVQIISYLSCGNSNQVVLYKILGGGHTWPNALINTTLGPTNRDMDGNQTIWNFFNQFTLGVTTGLEQASTNAVQVKFYPNPFKDELQITTDKQMARVEIFDVLGQIVLCKAVEANSVKLDLHGLKGICFVRLSGQDFSKTEKIFGL